MVLMLQKLHIHEITQHRGRTLCLTPSTSHEDFRGSWTLYIITSSPFLLSNCVYIPWKDMWVVSIIWLVWVQWLWTLISIFSTYFFVFTILILLQCIQYIHSVVQPSPGSTSRTFSSSQIQTLCSFSNNSIPLPHPPTTLDYHHSTFCVHKFEYPRSHR
jgi:hypothetical protein